MIKTKEKNKKTYNKNYYEINNTWQNKAKK